MSRRDSSGPIVPLATHKAARDDESTRSSKAADSEQLTADDIFGDMLAEVEAEAQRASAAPRPRKPAIPMDDIERKLEETLSGVMPIAGKKKRPGAARAPRSGSAPRERPTLPDDSEIDALLDQTLSSLDIPTRARKPAPSDPEPSPPAAVGEEEPRSDPPVDHPGADPAMSPGAAPQPDSGAGLDRLVAPEDQFRTLALPTFDVGKEAAEGEPFGDYTLLDRIAVGGMAEVWRARRRGVEGFQKTVAIKKILSHLTGSPDFVSMFIDEAKLAAQLTHNNIIQIYDLGKVGDDFFIAMELVDGKDLRSILTAAQETGRPVPPGLGLFVIGAVARALDYAHRKRDFDHRSLGLVHRDVSPQNVLISYEGAIKLCDFGIVKAVAKASTTQMGALKGKLQYMSPEQAWGKTVDARSDIFSLGSVLFEVLTGTQLFVGDSEIAVLDAVRECRIRSPRDFVPGIPEEVDRIVRKALAKTPEERYQTAGDLEQGIAAALDDLRPAPSQKDLASYLRSLFAAEDASAAEKTTVPDAAPPAAPAPAAEVVLPAAEGPDREPPAAEEALAEEPSSVEPLIEEPAGEPPTLEPLTAEPLTVEPVAEPSTMEPLTVEPAGEPAAMEPAAMEPAAVEPAALEPAAEPSDGAAGVGARTAPIEAEPSRGRSWGWLAAAIILGLLIALGLFFLRSQQHEETPSPVSPVPAAEIEEPLLAPPAGGPSPGGATAVEEAAAQDATAGSVEAGDVAASEPSGGLAAATGIDIEQMVNEELSNRAERLRQDFEAEKKRIEEELAKTRAAGSRPASEEEDDDGNESGDGR